MFSSGLVDHLQNNLFFCIKEFSEVLYNRNVGVLVPHFYVTDKSKTFDSILPLPDKIKDNFVGFFYKFLIYSSGIQPAWYRKMGTIKVLTIWILLIMVRLLHLHIHSFCWIEPIKSSALNLLYLLTQVCISIEEEVMSLFMG